MSIIDKVHRIRYIFIPLVLSMMDLSSKYMVYKFNVPYVCNRGSAFSIVSGEYLWHHYFLIIASIIFICCSIYYIHIHKHCNRFLIIPISIMLGGALGNLIDRIYNGYVCDFIDIGYKSIRWPTFNLADTFISIGVILTAYFISKEKNVQSNKSDR